MRQAFELQRGATTSELNFLHFYLNQKLLFSFGYFLQFQVEI